MKLFKIFIIFFFLGFSRAFAFPPPAPSAGIIEREIEKDYETKPFDQKREFPSLEIDIPEEKLAMPDDQKVFIKGIKVEGCHEISCKEISKHIDKRIHQEITIAQIYRLCSSIEKLYADRGYFLARAYPPVQKIENGILIIRIIEGKLGNITVEGNKHYSTAFILKYFKKFQNKPLKYSDFMRALFLINENSDLVVGAVFQRGKEVGFADVVLKVIDKRPAHLFLNSNDYGKKLLTNFRAGGRLNGGNILTYGDKFMFVDTIGFPVDALYYTNVTYSIPLNANGTFLEGDYLYSKFHIMELKPLHIKGKSEIGTLKLTHAFLRKRFLSIDGFAFFDYKQVQNFVLGERTSFDKLRILTMGFNLDHNSLNGRDYFNFRFAAGIPKIFNGLKAVDKTSSRFGAGGLFVKFNADYDRLQILPWESFFYFHGSAQASPYKLTLPEQIYIGGADTVRGFPVATVLGDSGYYLNFEYRFPLPIKQKFFFSKNSWKEHVQIVGFLDQGGVFLMGNKSFFPDFEKNYFLWGSGLGLRVKGPYNFDLSFDLGFPLNHKDRYKDVFTYLKLTWNIF